MHNLWLFLLASILLTVAPGPDNISVVTRGIAQGRPAALAAAFGFASGLIVHTLLVAFGLAAVINSSPGLFNLIKYAGAAYLLYLGYCTVRNRESFVTGALAQKTTDLKRIYCQSIIANLLNPKVSLFFLSFLPQFINQQATNPQLQALLLGAIFMAQTLVIFSLIALCSGWLGNWLRESPVVSRHLNQAAGVTFIAIGLRLAVYERRI